MKKKQFPDIYTFNGAVKALNQICAGLGDAFRDNFTGWRCKKTDSKTLHRWAVFGFRWADANEHYYCWCDVCLMLKEFENGEGCQK